MKKILRLAEEIIPLSSRQGFFLLLIISCFFQFALFYSPALAEDAVRDYKNSTNSEAQAEPQKQKEVEMIITMSSSKEGSPIINTNRKLRETTNAIINSRNLNYNLKTTASGEIDALAIDDKTNNSSDTNSEIKKVALALEPVPEKTEPEIRVISSSIHSMTAYNSEVGQTDDSPCITANGFNVCEHGIEDTIAANFLPFGTKVRVPELFGDRIFIVRDRMNKRYTERVDVWMLERSDALQFGVKKARIEVVEIIEPEIIDLKQEA
ncbi:3D domain-containing protein [Patescibacteria group bacterium]|nr:3D domain-containing protein [Patescibacteria group bacterium]